MTWCARCDELTMGSAGDACATCGATTLDATPVSTGRRALAQVLELEAPPINVTDETTVRPAPADAIAQHGRNLRVIVGRSRLVAAVLVTLLVGGTYIGVLSGRRPASTGKPSARPTPTASVQTATLPPLGEAAPGWIVFPFQEGFTLVELSTGRATTVRLPVAVFQLIPSPKGQQIAYLDDARVLQITDRYGNNTTPIATEVNYFSWTPNGEQLVVARSQMDGRGRERTRLELISITDRHPVLLAETRSSVIAVMTRRAVHLATLWEDEATNVYEVTPGSLKLVRKNATLLDVSPDGRHALVATQGRPQLLMIDLNTLKAKRIGPSRFLTMAATFSSDGRTVAISGTPHFTIEAAHCEDSLGTCEPFPVANDQILWALDMESLALRTIEAWPTSDFAGPPVWGPEGWLLLQIGQRSVAISVIDPSRPSVEFTGDYAHDWLSPQYLA